MRGLPYNVDNIVGFVDFQIPPTLPYSLLAAPVRQILAFCHGPSGLSGREQQGLMYLQCETICSITIRQAERVTYF